MKNRFLVISTVLTAVAVTGCTTSPAYNSGYSNTTQPAYSGSANCYGCGTVIRIETLGGGKAAPNSTGAVVGALVGALAGHEISDHTGGSKGNQNVAAAAGAVGGAVAGNAIQNNAQANTTYRIYVRMDNGQTTTITQNVLDGIREGSNVVVDGGRVILR